MDLKDPTHLAGAAFAVSSVSGLAAMLRSNQPLSWRLVFAAWLNSGIFGFAIFIIWLEYWGIEKHVFLAFGICALAGLGGVSLIDFALSAIQTGLAAYSQKLIDALPAPSGTEKRGEK